MLVALTMVGCSSSKPAVKDYVEISTSGYSGNGVLYYDIDYDKLIEDAIGIKIESLGDLFSEKSVQYNDFVSSLNVNVDQDILLKNGDKVKISFEISDKYKKKLNLKPLIVKIKDLDM